MGEGWHPPWSAQVELTEGCSRLCAFCGLNALRTGPGDYKTMSQETATVVASNLAAFCPDARVEFAMHGEPTMHPCYLERIALFRAFLPKTQMQITTNGVRMLRGRMQACVDDLFAAGIDIVMLDTYNPESTELRTQAAKLRGVRVADFYKDAVSPYHNHHRKVNRTVVLIEDLGVAAGRDSRRVMFNHTGSNPLSAPLSAPLDKTCTTAFREVSVCYDGTVCVCCMDWTRRYVCGVISDARSLESIWWGEEFTSARAFLGNRNRNFGACRHCDAGNGMRCGLLPKVGPVADAHRATVARVEAEGVARGYASASRGDRLGKRG